MAGRMCVKDPRVPDLAKAIERLKSRGVRPSRLLGGSGMIDAFRATSNSGALFMSTQTIVSPENIFNTLWGFQRTAALKTGIDLDIFTAIAEGDRTAAAIAKKSGASEPHTVIVARK